MADESAAVEAVEEQTPEESSESHGGSSAWIWNGHVTCDRILVRHRGHVTCHMSISYHDPLDPFGMTWYNYWQYWCTLIAVMVLKLLNKKWANYSVPPNRNYSPWGGLNIEQKGQVRPDKWMNYYNFFQQYLEFRIRIKLESWNLYCLVYSNSIQ